MAILLVHAPAGLLTLASAPPQRLQGALAAAGLVVGAPCGGIGACGSCRVRVVRGRVGPPTPAELRKLSAGDLARGCRLACQLALEGDAEIELGEVAEPGDWVAIPEEAWRPAAGSLPGTGGLPLGVAVDLGTTRIRVALWDLHRGRRLGAHWRANPQGAWGLDILNRLGAVRAHPELGAALQDQVRGAILQGVRALLAQVPDCGGPGGIGRLAVVGNTAMLALLTGNGGEALLNPDHWCGPVDIDPLDPVGWAARWQLPNTDIRVVPPLGGFVGSDLLAAVAATGLMEGPGGSMLLDLGTNTELVLWDGERLHEVSVPGGPAFESAGLRPGLPVQGLSGTALVDAVALLLEAGLLKASGRFHASPGDDLAGLRGALTPGEVDAFQRAKAATASAMEALLARAGLGWPDLRRLCLCGSFGHGLHVGHAQAVGLLPPMAGQALEVHEHAALSGCERALFAPEMASVFANLAGNSNLINLSLVPGWEDRFMAHLRLCPIPLEFQPGLLP